VQSGVRAVAVILVYPVYFAILALYCVLILWLGFVPERRGLFEDQLPYYVFGFPEHGCFDITGGIESASWSPTGARGASCAQGRWGVRVSYVFYLTHNFGLNLVEKTPLGNDGILWSIGGPGRLPALGADRVGDPCDVREAARALGHKLARGDKPFHAV